MEVLNNIGNGVKEGWGQLSKTKKIGFVSLLTTLLLVGSLLAFYIQRTDYTLLFSGIEEADAGKIVEDLEANKIAYKLEDKGTTILIDKKYVDKYRIGLAVNDMLPSNSTGFEIFDTTSMMATDQDRQISYQRAVQGELQRAITALDGISSAQVILSLPEESVFTRPGNRTEASASVMLATINGRTLTPSAIEGIAALISGAVENLPIQNVKIVDTKGSLLSAFLQSGNGMVSADLSSHNQQVKRSYEEALEQKVLQTLAPIYGAENLSVSVNAKMDFSSEEKEEVEYGESKVRSQVTSASGGKINSDILKETANDQTSTIVEGNEDGNTASYQSTINNELDTTTTKTITAPGEVTRVTASVLYNTGVPGLSERDLKELVITAIGAEEVVVKPANFAAAPEEGGNPIVPGGSSGTFLDKYMSYLLLGSGIFILGAVLASVVFSINRKRRQKYEWDEEEYTAAPEAENPEKDLEKLQNLLRSEKAQKEEDAHKYAKDNPELVADLIKMWMKDEK